MAVEFLGKTDILFWIPIDFSKAEIDITKENTLAIVEVKPASLNLVSSRFCETQKIQLFSRQ
jgi:hypothetical protein